MKKTPIIKGIPASRGVAEGVVRIINDIKKVESFDEGDILVTPMTDPSMVILMNKAAAIVTDFGGLTCHAAILSRELGVPCVVGTLNATKILKNGMNVKIHGNKGEVYLNE